VCRSRDRFVAGVFRHVQHDRSRRVEPARAPGPSAGFGPGPRANWAANFITPFATGHARSGGHVGVPHREQCVAGGRGARFVATAWRRQLPSPNKTTSCLGMSRRPANRGQFRRGRPRRPPGRVALFAREGFVIDPANLFHGRAGGTNPRKRWKEAFSNCSGTGHSDGRTPKELPGRTARVESLAPGRGVDRLETTTSACWREWIFAARNDSARSGRGPMCPKGCALPPLQTWRLICHSSSTTGFNFITARAAAELRFFFQHGLGADVNQTFDLFKTRLPGNPAHHLRLSRARARPDRLGRKEKDQRRAIYRRLWVIGWTI